jgi:60 kDa SS-A/Ro ribonucleoprotein
MAKLNTKSKVKVTGLTTHEGAPAKVINAEFQLRRSVMAGLLWENEFYEDGKSIAQRITELVPSVTPVKVAEMAVEAREKMKLRHIPLLIAREMARSKDHKGLVANTLSRIIQRADELTEFMAIYWKEGKVPLSAQIKKGLAKAFNKFDAYQLAKYSNREAEVTLRDVLFLCHAKPENKEQEILWKKLVDGNLETPDTWEVSLSAGKDKKETFERLLADNKLGALALLRNLRNMKAANVDENLIKQGLEKMNVSRVLPFRFIIAAKYAPHLESSIEKALFKSLISKPKLKGKTLILVDVSGSMDHPISDKSDTNRIDAACGVAILARELCESVKIYAFSEHMKEFPDSHVFALAESI